MRTCVKCDSRATARGLCNRHYLQAKKHNFDGVHRAEPTVRTKVEEWARAGENPACVDCGDLPLFGGMRCLDCFQSRCDRRKESEPHQYAEPPSYGCYVKGCRCRECRAASATVKRRNRLKAKAAA